jgi:peptide/nickel transport system substrate-binding protein
VKANDAGPGQASDYLWFNLNTAKGNGEKLESTPKYKWFNDKRFRQAIAYAVDRKSIAANTLQGLATPVYGFVPAGNKNWLDGNLKKSEYDLERSRALLQEAGFTVKDNAGKPELHDAEGNRVEFTLIVPAENEPRKLMAAVIQEDLAKLGIAMQVAPVEFKNLTERWTASFDYDAILSGMSLTATDPSSYSGLLLSSAGVHQWRPKQAKPATEWEAKIDQLYAEQSKERDPAARKSKFNEIQAIMADEMPIVPIVSRHIVSAGHERIGNLSPSTILPFSMWNAEKLFIK